MKKIGMIRMNDLRIRDDNFATLPHTFRDRARYQVHQDGAAEVGSL